MKFIYRCLLYIILFLPICYIFSWIHEGGHAISAILTGNEVVEINVNIFGGTCEVLLYDYYDMGFISIMGSVSTLIVAIPLFIYSIKKKNRWILLTAFMQILKEIVHWGISPFIKYGDPYILIKWATTLKMDVLVIVVYSIAIISIIMTVFMFIIYFYFFIKLEIETY